MSMMMVNAWLSYTALIGDSSRKLLTLAAIAWHLLTEHPEVTYTPGAADEEDNSDSDRTTATPKPLTRAKISGKFRCGRWRLSMPHVRAQEGATSRWNLPTALQVLWDSHQDVLCLQCATLSVRRVPFR